MTSHPRHDRRIVRGGSKSSSFDRAFKIEQSIPKARLPAIVWFSVPLEQVSVFYELFTHVTFALDAP
jgi:hypothetical protein